MGEGQSSITRGTARSGLLGVPQSRDPAPGPGAAGMALGLAGHRGPMLSARPRKGGADAAWQDWNASQEPRALSTSSSREWDQQLRHS